MVLQDRGDVHRDNGLRRRDVRRTVGPRRPRYGAGQCAGTHRPGSARSASRRALVSGRDPRRREQRPIPTAWTSHARSRNDGPPRSAATARAPHRPPAGSAVAAATTPSHSGTPQRVERRDRDAADTAWSAEDEQRCAPAPQRRARSTPPRPPGRAPRRPARSRSPGPRRRCAATGTSTANSSGSEPVAPSHP